MTLEKSKNYNFVVDLQKIDGDGTFLCPKCRNVISPDDESDNNYTIVDSVMANEGLRFLIVQCKKCNSKIKLVGFVE
jgi:predicted nucleic-acid-binding Zn-ribbon protein